MRAQIEKKRKRVRRHMRLRQKVSGTAARPRLAVFRSLRHIYAQLIDDEAGGTILAVSSKSEGFDGKAGGNAEGAKLVGKILAAKAKEKAIETVVFDRGGRKYHGRIKALAEAAREGGLKF